MLIIIIFSTRFPTEDRLHPEVDEDEERMRDIRIKLSQLGNIGADPNHKSKRTRNRKPKNSMQVYYVSELSSESDASGTGYN